MTFLLMGTLKVFLLVFTGFQRSESRTALLPGRLHSTGTSLQFTQLCDLVVHKYLFSDYVIIKLKI